MQMGVGVQPGGFENWVRSPMNRYWDIVYLIKLFPVRRSTVSAPYDNLLIKNNWGKLSVPYISLGLYMVNDGMMKSKKK